jgi:hypothetical protein
MFFRLLENFFLIFRHDLRPYFFHNTSGFLYAKTDPVKGKDRRKTIEQLNSFQYFDVEVSYLEKVDNDGKITEFLKTCCYCNEIKM